MYFLPGAAGSVKPSKEPPDLPATLASPGHLKGQGTRWPLVTRLI